MPGAEQHTISAIDRGARDVGLVVTNLLNELATLGTLLARAADDRWWLDAYLVAAGLNQIAEDHLHDAPYPLDDAASLLTRSDSQVGRLAGRAAGAGALAARRIAARRAGLKRTRDWQRDAAALVDDLADVVVGGQAQSAQALARRCRRHALEIVELPIAVRQAVLRLPACFHDFDQRPEDLARLVERFIEDGADRDRPVLVVGVRTSGNYLAPLLAAGLRARGHLDTRVLTLRPGRSLLDAERALVRAVAPAGHVLVTDDPPVTGASLAAACVALERLGVPQIGRAHV